MAAYACIICGFTGRLYRTYLGGCFKNDLRCLRCAPYEKIEEHSRFGTKYFRPAYYVPACLDWLKGDIPIYGQISGDDDLARAWLALPDNDKPQQSETK